MQTNHLCVLIHIGIMVEVGTVIQYCFNDHSMAVLLLWILFVIHVSYLSFLCCLVYSLQPCDHLLEKG